jgi:hypothetical protein
MGAVGALMRVRRTAPLTSASGRRWRAKPKRPSSMSRFEATALPPAVPSPRRRLAPVCDGFNILSPSYPQPECDIFQLLSRSCGGAACSTSTAGATCGGILDSGSRRSGGGTKLGESSCASRQAFPSTEGGQSTAPARIWPFGSGRMLEEPPWLQRRGNGGALPARRP